jgi:hypothetical protein
MNCSAGCRAQHQRAALAKKKSHDAMFFVNQETMFFMNTARQDAERSTSERRSPRKNRTMRCFS